MTRVTLPKIPKGNLGNVYVLSEKAADEFFRESSAIARECWPLPETYTVPSKEDSVVTLSSRPSIWLPYCSYDQKSLIGKGSFGISIGYDHRYGNGGGMSAGLGRIILDFLCDAERAKADDRKPKGYFPVGMTIVPNSHIFVYNLDKPEEINLPSEAFEWGIVNGEIREELNRKIKPAFNEIVDKIGIAMERRGAVLTRGMLSDKFVI